MNPEEKSRLEYLEYCARRRSEQDLDAFACEREYWIRHYAGLFAAGSNIHLHQAAEAAVNLWNAVQDKLGQPCDFEKGEKK